MVRCTKEAGIVGGGKINSKDSQPKKHHFAFLIREMFFQGLWIMYAGVTIQMAVAGMLTRPLEGSSLKRKNLRET